MRRHDGRFLRAQEGEGEIARPAMPDDKTKIIAAHPGAVCRIACDERRFSNEGDMMGSLY
jgi:hypothetical protein